MATLLSVNVGLPKDVAWEGRTVHTGVWKSPVEGPRNVRRLNVDGDGQGDLDGHGGEQRAVLVYQVGAYRHWERHLGRGLDGFGQFGENFTVDGLGDDEVCIGDRYRIGEAEFEVTQPRVACFRVGMRLGEPRLPALLVTHHRPGFYLRVITEGHVQAGDEIVRTRVGRHALSVADIDALVYLPKRDIEKLRLATDIPALSPGWQQSFRELLDATTTATPADGPALGGEPGWAGFRRLRVADVVAETSNVTSVYLVADDGDPLPRPDAGQYITLRAAGAGDPAPIRSYSVSSAPDAASYRISVKREPRGVVSAYVHALHPGSIVDIAAPRGDFVLTDGTNPVLLVSAGIGITPVLAMLHQLAAGHSTRDVWWIHTARDAQQHAFAGEGHRLLQSLPRAHERIFYTSATAEPSPTSPVIRGRPTLAALGSLDLPADAVAYLCGPTAFMNDMQAALTQLGIAADRIHTELFGARAALRPGVVDVRAISPHQPSGPPGTGPQISFSRSGLTVLWSSRDRSLLGLADACDVPTRWSCRTGVCHTCITSLLSGEIAYSPAPLDPPAADQVLICCSRPETDIVLDM